MGHRGIAVGVEDLLDRQSGDVGRASLVDESAPSPLSIESTFDGQSRHHGHHRRVGEWFGEIGIQIVEHRSHRDRFFGAPYHLHDLRLQGAEVAAGSALGDHGLNYYTNVVYGG